MEIIMSIKGKESIEELLKQKEEIEKKLNELENNEEE